MLELYQVIQATMLNQNFKWKPIEANSVMNCDGLHDHTYEGSYRGVQYNFAFIVSSEDYNGKVEGPKLILNKVNERALSFQRGF